MATVAAADPSRRWLYGPASDLLLGCGLGYALLFLLFLATGPALRERISADSLALLVVLIGSPHYGATLLRVYERREDRRAYALFAVHATVLVALAFVAGLRDPWIGSVVLTLYLTWSPWHYTGQNYGIAVMFLRRRGVDLDPGTKRWLYGSFLLSYGLSLLALHGTPDGASYAPFGAAEDYSVLRAGIPSGATALLFPMLGLSHLAALAVAGVRLGGRAPLAALAPAALLCVTQALWFSLPVAARRWHWLPGVDALRADHSGWYFFWIAIGHSVQYLWITAWYARAAGGARRSGGFVAKALLAGSALWAMPALLFAPDLLGGPPYEAGLGVMIAAAVNLHHFILDGAIWKLRDGRVARVLLRPAEGGARGAPAGRRVLARALLALGVLGLCAIVLAHFGRQGAAAALDAGDLARAGRRLDRLAWVGHDSASLRLRLGSERAARGELEEAHRALSRSLELRVGEATLLALADVEERRGDGTAALGLYERVLSGSPEHALALQRAGLLWRERGDLPRARELLARAVRADPRVREAHVALRDVEQALAAAPER
jgi:hypothetical protein